MYLLDTHIMLWWWNNSPQLPYKTRQLIADSEIVVSVAAIWEIVIKTATGRLMVDHDIPALLRQDGFTLLPVTFDHVWAIRTLPLHHADPFDRLMLAQASVTGYPLITNDRRLQAYSVPLLVV